MDKGVFNTNTKIISANNQGDVTTCYRRLFMCEQGTGLVRIAAKGTFVLYINGQRVLTRNIKSYDFHKYYDEIDVSRYMLKGQNCIVNAKKDKAGMCVFSYEAPEECILVEK